MTKRDIGMPVRQGKEIRLEKIVFLLKAVPYIITAAEDLVEMGKAPGIYEEYDDIDEAVLKYLEHIGKLKQKCP